MTSEERDRELADLFSAVDTDGSGEIDWDEFLKMISCATLPNSLPSSHTWLPLLIGCLAMSLRRMPLKRAGILSSSGSPVRSKSVKKMPSGRKVSSVTSVAPSQVRPPREAAQMLRMAIATVQADMRAIYGTLGRSQGTPGRVNMMGERMAEITARKRTCFLRPDTAFKRSWDISQIFMLFYVAMIVPFRIGFAQESTPDQVSQQI